jgi:hypothetical protein
MSNVINFPTKNEYKTIINGMEYTIYLTSTSGWHFKSGEWYKFGFRHGKGYSSAAEAQQAAMADAKGIAA